MGRTLLVWFVIIAAETLHGILRQLLLTPLIGDLPARQIGVLIGSLIILLVAYIFEPFLRAETRQQQFVVGLIWVLLTIAFEVFLGRLILMLDWERILEDYQITRGGFLSLGLAFMAVAPSLASIIRDSRRQRTNSA